MIKKNFFKLSVFAFLFSLSLTPNMLFANATKVKHTKAHKKHHNKSYYYNNDYSEKSKHNSSNKYDKRLFFGVGFGVNVKGGGSESDFNFDAIKKELFNPEANEDFSKVKFNTKFDYGFNPSLSLGYWVRDSFGVGVDVDYFSVRNKQADFEDYGRIETQIASASLMAHYFINIRNCIAPYFQIGIGAGHAMLDGAIVDPVAAGVAGTVIGSDLRFDSLTKNIGLLKIGAGLSKDINNTFFSIGYQFVKTTKIDDSSSNAKIQFAGGTLIKSEDFKFDDLSKNIHSINFFVKASI